MIDLVILRRRIAILQLIELLEVRGLRVSVQTAAVKIVHVGRRRLGLCAQHEEA